MSFTKDNKTYKNKQVSKIKDYDVLMFKEFSKDMINIITKKAEEKYNGPGLYDINDNLLMELTKEQVETNYASYGSDLISTNYMVQPDQVYKVVFPKDITNIGDYLFVMCSNLTVIEIPDTVQRIGKYSFYNCRNIKNLNIPANLTTLDDYSFCGLGITDLVIPDNVTIMGGSVFSNCANLKSITLPKTINKISNWMFDNCSKLTDIEIPSNITTIGIEAFRSCKALNLIVPSTVTTIERGAFSQVPCVCYDGPAVDTDGGDGKWYANTIHNYVNGICTVCGKIF